MALQWLQQRCPSCSCIGGQVATTKQELLMARKAIYDMEFHGIMARWIRVGDKTTKEFFWSKGLRHARTVMCNLNQEDGDEMRNIATTYYKTLLTEDSMTTGEDTSEDIILQSIPQKVMTKMNTWLTHPLSIIEIWMPSPIWMQIAATESMPHPSLLHDPLGHY